MYSEILEKLTEIVVEQLDVTPDTVTLDTNFYNLYSNELDPIELCMAIEEAFEVKISDEEAEKLSTVESVLDFILYKIYGVTLGQIKVQQNQEEREIKTKIFKFLNNTNLEIIIISQLLENDEIKSNWERISEFVKVVDQKSFTISEIARYSFIFQNNFILSNVENIYKIVIFVEQNNISIHQILFCINNGDIESIENRVEFIKNSIQEKQLEVNNLKKSLHNLNKEIQVLQTELNEFL
ncbi:acyl carrier protein [Geminocystis herdmanii]|uniref:acyl carrier protein n=1 Tax=Geminocystis herdmanii TaxID=669359 RepID=UPI0009FD1B41|nr:acyl carrier protein [Geminocystis herdmanii]